MLEDIKAKAFKALRRNLKRIQIFKQNKRLRHLQWNFNALRRTIESDTLLNRYLERSDRLRKIKFMQDVFKGFRFVI